jgi:hypothetical protein
MLSEKKKNHLNDHKQKDSENNNIMCDEDGDKRDQEKLTFVEGLDSKKPQKKKKIPKLDNTNKGVHLKQAFWNCCWDLDPGVKSISTAVPRSTNVCPRSLFND